MAKSRSSDAGAIQFRPGGSLARLLADRSKEWGISANEAARRLTLLAAYELDVRHHDALAEMAEDWGGMYAYEQACQHVHTAVESANRTRQGLKQKPFNEQERAECIVQTISLFLFLRDTAKGEAEKERHKISIYLHNDE